jgi:hypothetical protein
MVREAMEGMGAAREAIDRTHGVLGQWRVLHLAKS